MDGHRRERCEEMERYEGARLQTLEGHDRLLTVLSG